MSSSELIKETRDEEFAADVIERSEELPVVVDFWADWCQPCRTIAPLLEELATEYEGRVAVVKANTEYNTKAADQFGVQGIPAFFGVIGGEIVDGMSGADIGGLKEMFERLIQLGVVAAARSIEESEPEQAIAKYKEILAEDAENVSAKIGLARASLAKGEPQAATEIIEELERRGFLEQEAQQLKSQIALSGHDAPADLADLEAKVSANPEDFDVAISLARALAGSGNYERALQISLEIVEKAKLGQLAKSSNDGCAASEEARKLMLDVFNSLPENSPLTSDYRRKLAMALY